MSYFVELPRRDIEAVAWDRAIKAARWGAAELDLPYEPAVRWFREGASWMKSQGMAGFDHDTRRPAGLAGTTFHDPRTIWIREGQSPSEELVTVLHELRHLQQGPDVTGKSAEREERNEDDAERWGRRAAQEYLARPAAIKSAQDLWTPTVTLTKSGHAYGFDDVADLTPSTRFGEELYGPTRALVMGQGMGSLTAKRLGTVTNLGVDDNEARLWFTAQIAESDKYRGWLSRLVEQGAMRAKALVTDHHIARDDRGGLTELPVAAVSLSPATPGS